MLKKQFTAKLPEMESEDNAFIHLLTEDKLLVLYPDFRYSLLVLSPQSQAEVSIIKGRLPEKFTGKNQMPGHRPCFDCTASGTLVYTSIADGCIKVFDLAAIELIEVISIPPDALPVAEGFEHHFLRFDEKQKRLIACYSSGSFLEVYCKDLGRKELEKVGEIAIPQKNSAGMIQQSSPFGIVFAIQVFDCDKFELGVIQLDKVFTVGFELYPDMLIVAATLVAESTLIVLFNEGDDKYGSLILNLKCAAEIGSNNYYFSKGNEGLQKVSLAGEGNPTGTLSGEIFFHPKHNDLWYALYDSIRVSKLIIKEGQYVFSKSADTILPQNKFKGWDYHLSSAIQGSAFLELNLDYETGSLQGVVYQAACIRTQYYWLASQVCTQNELMPTDIMEIVDLLA